MIAAARHDFPPSDQMEIDWGALATELDAEGFATLPRLLSPTECRALAALYDDESLFRSRVIMQRHAFGQGEYRYFAYPLPPLIERLRQEAYAGLAPIANAWCERLGLPQRYPARLPAFLSQCRKAGQARSTPLLLKYETGGYNCLHRDLYGAQAFPLQMTVLLSRPGRDFAGGEFLLVEQRPRAQSSGRVVPLVEGTAVVFAVNERPVAGRRGFHRVALRHGVSKVTKGQRFALGIIFHDAA